MANQSNVSKIDQSQIDYIGSPMELDLVAYFNLVMEEVQKIVEKADKYTLKELEDEIAGLFNG